jgi:hypothetical protein
VDAPDGRCPQGPHRKFYAFLNGTQKRISTLTSANSMIPRFLGETAWECACMDADAESAFAGPSLQGHGQGTGYSFWQEHHKRGNILGRSDENCWHEEKINGYAAADLAYGPDSSTCT